MRERKISLGRESVCERHTREWWRDMRPWETEFVFVCEKEILKRKSHRFSYLIKERKTYLYEGCASGTQGNSREK